MTDRTPAKALGAKADGPEVVVAKADGLEVVEGIDLVDPRSDVEDRLVDAALRPRNLGEFVGQERVREQLSLILDGARRRGRPADHVLLSGSARPRQDDPRHDHRGRDECAAAHHQWSGDPARR